MPRIVGLYSYQQATKAAQAAAKRAIKEEEDMTQYNANDIDGWEFKIVRNLNGSFKKPGSLQQVCDEEAKAGWVMLEKFDNYRIRFKRRIEKRSNDQYLQGFDPYRTMVGMSGGMLAFIIVGSILGLVGAILGTVYLIQGYL